MLTPEPTISFIGAGNMAGAIIRGLIDNGYPANKISATASTRKNLAALESDWAIATSQNNLEFVESDIIVLGVKPQVMKEVCEEIAPSLQPSPLFISLAAGINCVSINSWLSGEYAIVRCMANTPAQINQGASGLFANAAVTAEQKSTAEKIIGAVGITRWVDEEALIDTVTAVSGSGPAYFFLFVEAMVDAAVAQGMDKVTATELALATASGAAELAQHSEFDLATLRANVTSPNGTTERAIASFEHDKLRRTVANAMDACAQRARELAALN